MVRRKLCIRREKFMRARVEPAAAVGGKSGQAEGGCGAERRRCEKLVFSFLTGRVLGDGNGF